jgi:hypothetical protein
MKKTSTIISLFFLVMTIKVFYATGEDNFFNLDSISDKYQAVRFNHTRHIDLAGNCGTCHHEHGDNGSLPCKNCHSLSKTIFKNSVVNGFMACRNCHGTINPDSPSVPSLKVAYHRVCFQCHRGMGEIGMSPKGCTNMCHAEKVKKVGMNIKR